MMTRRAWWGHMTTRHAWMEGHMMTLRAWMGSHDDSHAWMGVT